VIVAAVEWRQETETEAQMATAYLIMAPPQSAQADFAAVRPSSRGF
jgi:hypothetical protein